MKARQKDFQRRLYVARNELKPLQEEGREIFLKDVQSFLNDDKKFAQIFNERQSIQKNKEKYKNFTKQELNKALNDIDNGVTNYYSIENIERVRKYLKNDLGFTNDQLDQMKPSFMLIIEAVLWTATSMLMAGGKIGKEEREGKLGIKYTDIMTDQTDIAETLLNEKNKFIKALNGLAFIKIKKFFNEPLSKHEEKIAAFLAKNNDIDAQSSNRVDVSYKVEQQNGEWKLVLHDSRLTLLMQAAKEGDATTVQLLLDAQANPSLVSRANANALFYALLSKDSATINALLTKCTQKDLTLPLQVGVKEFVPPFKVGDTPITAAIHFGNSEVIKASIANSSYQFVKEKALNFFDEIKKNDIEITKQNIEKLTWLTIKIANDPYCTKNWELLADLIENLNNDSLKDAFSEFKKALPNSFAVYLQQPNVNERLQINVSKYQHVTKDANLQYISELTFHNLKKIVPYDRVTSLINEAADAVRYDAVSAWSDQMIAKAVEDLFTEMGDLRPDVEALFAKNAAYLKCKENLDANTLKQQLLLAYIEEIIYKDATAVVMKLPVKQGQKDVSNKIEIVESSISQFARQAKATVSNLAKQTIDENFVMATRGRAKDSQWLTEYVKNRKEVEEALPFIIEAKKQKKLNELKGCVREELTAVSNEQSMETRAARMVALKEKIEKENTPLMQNQEIRKLYAAVINSAKDFKAKNSQIDEKEIIKQTNQIILNPSRLEDYHQFASKLKEDANPFFFRESSQAKLVSSNMLKLLSELTDIRLAEEIERFSKINSTKNYELKVQGYHIAREAKEALEKLKSVNKDKSLNDRIAILNILETTNTLIEEPEEAVSVVIMRGGVDEEDEIGEAYSSAIKFSKDAKVIKTKNWGHGLANEMLRLVKNLQAIQEKKDSDNLAAAFVSKKKDKPEESFDEEKFAKTLLQSHLVNSNQFDQAISKTFIKETSKKDFIKFLADYQIKHAYQIDQWQKKLAIEQALNKNNTKLEEDKESANSQEVKFDEVFVKTSEDTARKFIKNIKDWIETNAEELQKETGFNFSIRNHKFKLFCEENNVEMIVSGTHTKLTLPENIAKIYKLCVKSASAESCLPYFNDMIAIGKDAANHLSPLRGKLAQEFYALFKAAHEEREQDLSLIKRYKYL